MSESGVGDKEDALRLSEESSNRLELLPELRGGNRAKGLNPFGKLTCFAIEVNRELDITTETMN